MLKHEPGSYERGMATGGEPRRAWEHKDPSHWYWANKSRKSKGIMGTLGFLVGGKGSIEAVGALEKIVDMPQIVELGLVATGTVLLTYLGIKAGEKIINHERKKYQS